jgi:hypothetical protein
MWRATSGSRRDLELVLEPNANSAGKAFQEAMFAQGIPLAAFEAADIAADHARLKAQGVGVHARAYPHGAGHDCRVLGHLRQPDSAVPAGVAGVDGAVHCFGACLAAVRSEWFSRWY